MDLHRFTWIFIDSLPMVCHGIEKFWDQNVGAPVAACATLCHPVPLDWIGLILRFQILEAWIWRPGAWMLEGLEWIGGGDRGIGMGGGDWKKFSHARASGARRILRAFCDLSRKLHDFCRIFHVLMWFCIIFRYIILSWGASAPQTPQLVSLQPP